MKGFLVSVLNENGILNVSLKKKGDGFLLFSGTGKELKEVLKNWKEEFENLERCPECGAILSDEDIHYVNEGRGYFGDFHCSEEIAVGFKCPYCGYSERF